MDVDKGCRRSRYYSPWLIGIGIAFVLLVVSFSVPMGQDEGMWSYIGRIWVEDGLPPYVAAVENKTPGVFELFAVSHLMFGTTVTPMRILGILSIVATSLVIYYIDRELESGISGILAMTMFGFAMGWRLMDGYFIAHTETFMILFSSLAILLLLKTIQNHSCNLELRTFFCGLLLGLAINFKQIALFSYAGWICLLFLSPIQNATWRRKLIAAMIAGFGIALALTVAAIPLFATGVSFKDYVEGAWLILFSKGSSPPIEWESYSAFEAIVRSLIERVFSFFEVWIASRVVLFYPFLLLLVFDRKLWRNQLFVGLVAWGVFEFLGSNASGYYYGHQLRQPVPALASIVGIALGRHIYKMLAESKYKGKHAVVLLLFVILLWLPYEPMIRGGVSIVRGTSDSDRAMGYWIKNNSERSDYIYIAARRGSPVLAYSDRLSSSRYFSTIFLLDENRRKELLRDFAEKPPIYVLMDKEDKSPNMEWLRRYVRLDYRPINTEGRFDVFLRMNSIDQVTGPHLLPQLGIEHD